ncbi:MAG: MATE family efflux transporter [Candidatus Eremiobacteraeota bacterium]|nr:MATE family efflux transporter [Candidatus Eremiobacteraeota bacterium]
MSNHIDTISDENNGIEKNRLPGEKEPEPVDIKSVRKNITSLAIPSIGEFILHMSIGIVDLAFVGRLGAEATASSGIAWQVIWFMSMLFFGINAGTIALVARYTGAGHKEKAQAAAGQSLIIATILSFFATLFFIYYADGILRILGAKPDITQMGASYLRILASSFMCMSLMMNITASIKSSGDTRTPMFIAGALVVLNVFLDYGLIFGKFGLPAHGFLGSAEASVIVTSLGTIFCITGIFLGWFKIKITPENFLRLRWDIIGKILKIGLPVSLEHLFWVTAAALFVWMVARMGTVPLAVHNILLRAESFSFMPGIGFSVAARVAVGQALGEGNKAKARACAWESVKMGSVLMGAVGLVFVLFPHMFIKIFTNDPAVIAGGAETLRIIGIIQPIQGILFVLMGTLKGAGDTKATMVIAFVGLWCVRIPLAYIFGVTLGLGVLGAWGIGMTVDIALRAYLCYHRFLGGKWMKVKV